MSKFATSFPFQVFTAIVKEKGGPEIPKGKTTASYDEGTDMLRIEVDVPDTVLTVGEKEIFDNELPGSES